MITSRSLSLPYTPLIFSSRQTIRASQDRVHLKTQKFHLPCNCCFRRKSHFIKFPAAPNAFRQTDSVSEDITKIGHNSRPDWYEEFFAWFMKTCTQPYQAAVFDLTTLRSLRFTSYNSVKIGGKAEKALETGIGTGPNLKHCVPRQHVFVFGMDPNAYMEKYALESAAEVGLRPESFRFIRGVGEAIPLEHASVDAVVGTLVMCSVLNVTQTLNEIKRVLKPGGVHIFVEHVAAEDGTFLKVAQNLLDPLQQLILDGCHITRRTGDYISEAGFNGGVEINTAFLASIPWISRHVFNNLLKRNSSLMHFCLKTHEKCMDFLYDKSFRFI